MTVMDILEFRDMNGPAPMLKSRVMRSNKVRWAILPAHLPLFRVKGITIDVFSAPGNVDIFNNFEVVKELFLFSVFLIGYP